MKIFGGEDTSIKTGGITLMAIDYSKREVPGWDLNPPELKRATFNPEPHFCREAQ